jgi:hypothetical protein
MQNSGHSILRIKSGAGTPLHSARVGQKEIALGSTHLLEPVERHIKQYSTYRSVVDFRRPSCYCH